MQVTSADETEQISTEAAELLTRQWRFPESAPVAGLAKLWRATAAQGWFNLDDINALATVLALIRATGAAARRARDHSIAHAKVRKQFDRPIGSFGAVQQRAATRKIDLVSGELLIHDAMRRYDANSPDWTFSAEPAVSHATVDAPLVQTNAHQTLGAVGYFEEHDDPRLFRRVHADIVRLRSSAPPRGTVADVLVETNVGLPSPDSDPEATAWRDQVRSFCAEHLTHARLIEKQDDPALVAMMAARKWFGIIWPAQEGGSDGATTEQLAIEEK